MPTRKTESSQMSKTEIRTKPKEESNGSSQNWAIEQLGDWSYGLSFFFSISQRNSPMMNSTDLTKVNEWSG